MLAIGVGVVMAVLDGAVCNIALPSMGKDLQAEPASAVWIVNAYQLAVVAALLPFAALGECRGYRRVYLDGLVVFTIGSIACALSPTLEWLVASRVVQGVGAAGLMAVSGALVRFTYPTPLLGRGIGLNSLVVAFAAALGPTLASALLALGGWPWLFAINVPLGVGNLVLASSSLPESDPTGQRLDWFGAALMALAVGLLFVGIDGFNHGASMRWVAAAEVALSLALCPLLVTRERRTQAPLVPMDLLGNSAFTLSVVASVCAFTTYTLAFLMIPFLLQNGLHRDQMETGLSMTAWPVALGVIALVAGRLSDHVPASLLCACGLAILAVGMSSLAGVTPQDTVSDVACRMAACGLGFGLFQSPNNRVMLSVAPRGRMGAAGGMLAIARQVGMTAGATIAALLFHFAADAAESTGLTIGAALAAMAAIASLARGRGGSGTTSIQASSSARSPGA